MDNALIGKIEKAKRYAEEKDRIEFQSFIAEVQGNNSTHVVHYDERQFNMDDSFFQTHGFSAHTMAMERLLNGMINPVIPENVIPAPESTRISKIEKAKRYAEEKDRIKFKTFVAKFRGDNDTYLVRYENGKFDSDNSFFRTHGYSAHTMAMERILGDMLEKPVTEEV